MTGQESATEPVLYAIEDGLVRLRLNRPASANGMDLELLRGLCDAIMRAHAQPGLRAVLLTGEGANFCAGGDVRTFAAKAKSCRTTSGRRPPISRARLEASSASTRP
jgi:enoyl-CoA hydratase/carnithine racemase